MKKEEHYIQSAAVQQLRLLMPNIIIYAIPNGGYRNKATAYFLKNEGVLPGIPDLHIPHAHGGYNSLYVEVKSKNGKLTPNQKILIEQLKKNGNQVLVLNTVEDIVDSVKKYLSKPKTT